MELTIFKVIFFDARVLYNGAKIIKKVEFLIIYGCFFIQCPVFLIFEACNLQN